MIVGAFAKHGCQSLLQALDDSVPVYFFGRDPIEVR